MAINSKNYVDISTRYPSVSTSARAFGGLVFTTAEMNAVEGYASIKAAYDNGKFVELTLADMLEVFGESSDEYKFAAGYYSYISPSGHFSSLLKVAKTIDSPLVSITRIDKQTNRFGSFTFIQPHDSSGSDADEMSATYLEQLKAVAQYNTSLDTKYLFVVNEVKVEQEAEAEADEVVANCAEFRTMNGTCFIYGAHRWSGYMPMAILASTAYQNGTVVNYMFKQFTNEEPTVFDDRTYKSFNKGLVNFYGRTQSNGQTLDFFQRGFNTDGRDTAIYCNEMWFKATCETSLLDSLVSQERIPADLSGVASVKLVVMDCCSAAVRNGTFMQKAEVSGDDLRTIREIINLSDGDDIEVAGVVTDLGVQGYSIYAYLSEVSDDSEIYGDKVGASPEKCIVYYVFYGTADSVRYVRGNNILIK